MQKYGHTSSVPDSYTLLLFIVKSYLNVSVLMSDMNVCVRVCTKSFLKTTTNVLCVCAHLANKAHSDSLLRNKLVNLMSG